MPVYEYEFQSKLIALQIEICKQLASNDVKNRKKGLRRLRTFLSSDQVEKSGFEDFSRIWVGLFNYVWMSDTPLVQEADAEEISNLIHGIGNFDAVLLFVRGFFTTISNQWDRISHFRTDKFLMFIRRFLRQIFFLLKNSDWNSEKVEKVSSEFYSAIQILPVELTQHLNDIYTEELAKVSGGSVPTDTLIKLLKCFVDCILQQKPSKAVVNYINANIFCPLVRQLKLLIKQKAAMGLDPEMYSLEASEMKSNSSLDPRPGNVHVFLPYIDFDEKKIVEFLEKSISSAQICQRAKNILTQNVQMFESVTRLRQSMSQPAKILHEVCDRGRKRKRKSEKFSSLIKKAYKRLDDKDDDFGTKKMKKLVRSSTTWEVTKNVDTTAKPSVIQDWAVSELRKKGPVSFSEKTDSFTYEADSSRPRKTSSVSVVVPRIECHSRPGILIPDKNYAIVDFGNLEDESKITGNDNSIPKKSEKKRKTKSISPRKTRSGKLAAARSKDTASIEPPWISTQLEETVSIKSPIKNESVRRRSTRQKSAPVEISEDSNSIKSCKRRKYGSVKTVKIPEEVAPSIEEKSDSENFPVKNETAKQSRGRKSKAMKTLETSEKSTPPKQGKSDDAEIPDKDENTERIKKSILHRTKYEPRKTRSGRIYNV